MLKIGSDFPGEFVDRFFHFRSAVSGLHKKWPFAYFEKITVAVGWVYIKNWPIPHLKALTATFQLMK